MVSVYSRVPALRSSSTDMVAGRLVMLGTLFRSGIKEN